MGESLGTLTVGVSANVDPAQQAITKLADSLDDFMRKMERGGTGKPRMFAQIDQHVRDFEEAQKKAFAQASSLELPVLNKRMYLPGEQEAMQQGDLVAAADIRIKKERELNNVLQQRDDIQQQQMDASNRGNGQATRQLDGMANSANRVKYAVLNLGYGVQDAATVFGTGGLAGAVRASANNLSGLGVLLAETKGGMAGLGAAVMSVELGIVALATGVMIAADAWQKYEAAVKKANEEQAKADFRRFNPEAVADDAAKRARAVEDARGLEDARAAKEAADKKRADIRVNQAAQQAIREQRRAIEQELMQSTEMDRLLKGAQRNVFVDPDTRRRTDFRSPEEKAAQATGMTIERSAARTKELGDKLKQNEEERKKLAKERLDIENEIEQLDKRAGQLAPQKIEEARQQLQQYQRQVQDLDSQEKKLRDEQGRGLESRKAQIEDEQRVAEIAQGKLDLSVRLRQKATMGTRKSIREQYALTDEEIRALNMSGKRDEERKDLDKQIADYETKLGRIVELRGKLQGDIAKLLEMIPGLGPKPRGLEEEQSDMEYRLNFLGRRRREIMAQSRASMANVGVAALESSTAYESLARSRMQQDPQTDLLQRIVRAEEMATKELAAIREKLDPGRGARIAILEKID